MNVIIIIGAIFLSLFVITKLLEGRAEPMSPEKAQKLSRVAMILIGISMLVALFKHLG